MADHIDSTSPRSPEIITEARDDPILKHEQSTYDEPRLRQSKTGLSWRTRFMGGGRRTTTIHVSEVDKSSNGTPQYDEPIRDQEEHQAALTEHEMRELGKNFHPPSQLWKLLFKHSIKWLITVAFEAAIGGIMYYYSTHVRPMTDNDKKTYNFLVIGLSLALSINIGSSMKALATDVRWWVLSLRRRKLREMDLILHMDSLTAVTKLAFTAPRLAPACFTWLFVNIAFQVGIALIGLCYSPDTVTNTALIQKGPVYVPDMSQVYTEAHSSTSNKSDVLQDQQYTANNFGNIALDYYWTSDLSKIPDPGTLWAADSPIMFEGSYYWQYIFQDRNADAVDDPNNINPATIFTNRSVYSVYACDSWPVTDGGNGTSLNITILLDANGHFKHVTLPYAGGSNQTTFITVPDNSDCGKGCSIVHAFEASDFKPWYYECNMTVSDTNNATLPEHQVGQPLAKMSAAAIALQGHVADPVQNKTGEQFQTYPASSVYGFPRDGSIDLMGGMIGRFAIGVVATAAQWNPPLRVDGEQPDTGSQLQVYWTFISLIFGLTVGFQLVLFIVLSMVSNLVIVKDDSALATARLLRPIVERLGPVGTAASGKQICRLLGNEGQEKVVYSVRHPQTGYLHHLDMGHQKRLRAFPRGNYD